MLTAMAWRSGLGLPVETILHTFWLSENHLTLWWDKSVEKDCKICKIAFSSLNRGTLTRCEWAPKARADMGPHKGCESTKTGVTSVATDDCCGGKFPLDCVAIEGVNMVQPELQLLSQGLIDNNMAPPGDSVGYDEIHLPGKEPGNRPQCNGRCNKITRNSGGIFDRNVLATQNIANRWFQPLQLWGGHLKSHLDGVDDNSQPLA